MKIAAAETREEWGGLAGRDKVQEDLGGGVLADNKDLNPRSTSLSFVFSPFLTEDLTPDMSGGKPNYVSAAG